MISLAEHLETKPMGEVIADRKKAEEAKAMKRLYAGAKSSRGNIGWINQPTSQNYELRTSLALLRARAREMCRNNGYGKNFLSILRKNVIGPTGIKLQCRAKFNTTGKLNSVLNDTVEAAFREWGHMKYASMSGKLNWVDQQNLFISQLARDGEVLVRVIRGANNKFGFSLKFIDVSYLDETFNEVMQNGNRVIMSVEVDVHDRPVAYWLTTPSTELWGQGQSQRKRIRVPASEMIHAYFIREDEAESRGLTWFHTTLVESKDLHGYKFGVISSARTAAYAFGFLRPPDNDLGDYDGTDDKGRPLNVQIDPLSINELPAGYELQQFDPKQPTQNHAEFYKSILYDVAASLETNYTTLTGDLSDVNYSSIRAGKLDEQDLWRCLSGWVSDHFCQPVYEMWLQEAFLHGALDIAVRSYNDAKEANWQPRGWNWVDPAKEASAKVISMKNNLSTLTDELAERGKDIEEHFKTLKRERELAEKYGIDLEYERSKDFSSGEVLENKDFSPTNGNRETEKTPSRNGNHIAKMT